MERQAETHAADTRKLALLADHEVEAEVIRAGAAVALGDGHAQKTARAGARVELARDDPLALPLRVASLLADDLAREERAKARAEVFVEVLEQGGFDLEPRPLDSAHPLIRSGVAYSALLASSLSVSQAAARLHVDDSRIRQRLGERTLYGIKLKSVWRLPRFQFIEQGMVPGIERVLPHLDPALHPLSVVGWFTTPNPDLVYGEDEEPGSPLDWLRAGYPAEPLSELAGSLTELG